MRIAGTPTHPVDFQIMFPGGCCGLRCGNIQCWGLGLPRDKPRAEEVRISQTEPGLVLVGDGLLSPVGPAAMAMARIALGFSVPRLCAEVWADGSAHGSPAVTFHHVSPPFYMITRLRCPVKRVFAPEVWSRRRRPRDILVAAWLPGGASICRCTLRVGCHAIAPGAQAPMVFLSRSAPCPGESA